MRKFVHGMSLFFVFFTLAPGLVAKPAEGIGTAGHVTSVIGIVKINGKPVQEGASVYEKDTIHTEVNSGVKILMIDYTILDIGASTDFEISDYKIKDGRAEKVDLTLFMGRIRTEVNRKIKKDGTFFIRTNSAVLGVRGTVFALSTAELCEGEDRVPDDLIPCGDFVLTMIKGSALVQLPDTSTKPVEIPAGDQIIVSNAPPTYVTTKPEEISEGEGPVVSKDPPINENAKSVENPKYEEPVVSKDSPTNENTKSVEIPKYEEPVVSKDPPHKKNTKDVRIHEDKKNDVSKHHPNDRDASREGSTRRSIPKKLLRAINSQMKIPHTIFRKNISKEFKRTLTKVNASLSSTKSLVPADPLPVHHPGHDGDLMKGGLRGGPGVKKLEELKYIDIIAHSPS